MCLDDAGIRRHLAVSREAAVRQRGFEFLKWARDEAGLCPKSGDERWNAVDVMGGDKVVARVFPKDANLLKIFNLAHLEDGHYGKAVPLTENNEWAFDLASARFEMPIAKTCVMDQLS